MATSQERRRLGAPITSPLGCGILTSGLRDLNQLSPHDWRRDSPRFRPENFSKNVEIIKRLDADAKEWPQ